MYCFCHANKAHIELKERARVGEMTAYQTLTCFILCIHALYFGLAHFSVPGWLFKNIFHLCHIKGQRLMNCARETGCSSGNGTCLQLDSHVQSVKLTNCLPSTDHTIAIIRSQRATLISAFHILWKIKTFQSLYNSNILIYLYINGIFVLHCKKKISVILTVKFCKNATENNC